MKKIIVSLFAIFAFAYAYSNTNPISSTTQPDQNQVELQVFDDTFAQDLPSGHTKKNFKVAWSIYVGWNPWEYARVSGILKRWADKYGITIDLVLITDYVGSIEAYTAGQFDACVMTNMDLLTIPVNAGIASTVIVVGDYSNGNDAIVTKLPDATSLKDIKKLWGVQYSVSHYLLNRAEEKNNLKTGTIEMTNVSENEIVGMFSNNRNISTVVTWNPFVMDVLKVRGAKKLFDSSQIPGEILDLLVVNTSVVESNPDFARAMVGAWYETMQAMSARGERGSRAMEIMAKVGGSSLLEYQKQLETTVMFYRPQDALNFSFHDDFATAMRRVRNFCVKYKLLEGINHPDDLGILLPNGSVLGSSSNVRLKFDMRYTQAAADGNL